MVVSLPYKLREGQIAYAAKVMANFEALLGMYKYGHVDGLGDGDVFTLMELLCKAVVMAGDPGNAEQIVFEDGETLVHKFNAGTLNASLLDNEGMFYCSIGDDGHLYITASEGIEEGDFSIGSDGHLLYTLSDPASSSVVHTYDLGLVKGQKGDPGAPGMVAAVYDPEGMAKDLNTYTSYYSLPEANWGAYFLTYDSKFLANKTYYVESSGSYVESTVTVGDDVPINTYYEKLANTDCLLTDLEEISGVPVLTGHISSGFGHALVGPAPAASDTEKLTWSAAMVTAVGQGGGVSAEGANNSSSWIKFRALGTVPTDGVLLMVSVYM